MTRDRFISDSFPNFAEKLLSGPRNGPRDPLLEAPGGVYKTAFFLWLQVFGPESMVRAVPACALSMKKV